MEGVKRIMANGTINLQTIYDDVAELQEQVAALQEGVSEVQTQLAEVETQTIEEGTDLNTLNVGIYVIPNTIVCATLLNKPTVQNWTALIKVTPGGASGQKMMDYIPCANIPVHFHREFYGNEWHEWHTIDLSDSGWIDLNLLNNVLPYNTEQSPQYRKIGNYVTIRGVLKNITSFPTTIAQLPEGFRPTRRLIYFMVSNGGTIGRLEIETTGIMNVTYHSANNAGTVSDGTHYSFGTLTFLVN